MNDSNKLENKLDTDAQLVQQYVSDIRNIPLLDRETERHHIIRFQKYNDDASRDILIQSNLRFVILVAKRYCHFGISLPDLIGAGNIALFNALESYDLNYTVRFVTYAYCWIRQDILATIAQQSKTMRLPISRFRDLQKIKKIVEQRESEQGERVEMSAVAEELGLSERYMIELQCMNSTPLSLDDELGIEAIFAKQQVRYRNDNFYQPETDIMHKDMHKQVTDLLGFLSKREADIIVRRFGLRGYSKHSLRDIAHLHRISKERVRQIEAVAMQKLKKHATRFHIQEFIYN